MPRRKAQMFKLNEDGIVPKELSDILQTPAGIDLSKPLIQPYIREEISIPSVDIALIDVQRFYVELMNDIWSALFSQCSGMYLSKNHCWDTDNTDVLEKLKKDYCIDLPEVILMGKKPDYFILAHEYLHVFFNHLSEDKRNHLVDSIKSYAPLSDALSLTHLNISHFDWPEKVENEYLRLLDAGKPTTHLYTLDKLEKRDRLMCVDEIIANIFCVDRTRDGVSRWNRLPVAFIDAMEDVGYNVTNPPEIVRGAE